MRVMVGSSSGSGHVGPLVPVAAALIELGDEVAVVAPPAALGHFSALELHSAPAPEPADHELHAVWAQVGRASPAQAAVLVNREIFARLNTAARLHAVDDLVNSWRPDLILHEAAEFAPAVIAHRRGIAHVQIAIGLAEVEAGSLAIARPVLEATTPGVVDAIWASTYLTHLPASMDTSPYPDTKRFRRKRLPVPGNTDGQTVDPSPLVYVSLGTVVGRKPDGRAAIDSIVDALGGMPVRAIVSLGGDHWRPTGPIPPHVRIEEWVDPVVAMSGASAVLCHGGAGTTFEALASGRPLVIVPFMADQPVNARLVDAAGAGVVLAPGHLTPDGIRSALSNVLNERRFTDAARRVAADLALMPDVSEVLAAVVHKTGT